MILKKNSYKLQENILKGEIAALIILSKCSLYSVFQFLSPRQSYYRINLGFPILHQATSWHLMESCNKNKEKLAMSA